jgi:hypothetical protein
MGAVPAARRMREPSRGAVRAIRAKKARKAVAPAADPAAVAAAAEDGAAGAGAGSSAGATVAPRSARCGAVGRGATDRCGVAWRATSTTAGATERLDTCRWVEGVGVAVAALAATPRPRRSRAVFRDCAGFGEETDAGLETVRLTVGATLRATAAGAWATSATGAGTGAVSVTGRSTARRTVAAVCCVVLTGATARCAAAWTEETAAVGPLSSGSLACAEVADAAYRTHAASRPARPTRHEGQERLAHINIRSSDSPKVGALTHRQGNCPVSRRWE